VSPAGTTSVRIKPGVTPEKFELFQNYPNPFNPSTTIRFGIPEKSYVKIAVYNLIGERVADLLNSELNSGYHEVIFNTNELSSGIYFYSIEAGTFTNVKKMLLLK
jgi:hypothetical protein